MLKIFMSMMLSGFLFLSGYELPKLHLEPQNKVSIVIFKAESVLVGEKLSYVLKWETVNATDVNITFIGKVDLSGSFTITEDEYNRGPITLTAFNQKKSESDTKTINEQVEGLAPPVVFKNDVSDDEGDFYYNTRPGLRGRQLPRARRYY